MKISLVIPFYNEERILPHTIAVLDAYMRQTFPEYEIIFSDDGSTDHGKELVQKYSSNTIRYVGYGMNRGKGAAVRNGMLHAEGDLVFFTDCDMAYGTEVMEQAVKIFEQTGADLVIGSRNKSKDGYAGYTFLRKFASKMYIKVLAFAAGFRLTDSQCGFKGFSKNAVKALFSQCEINGWAFDFEVLIKAKRKNYTIIEMPVKILNHRESKIHVFSDTVKMLGDVRKIKRKN